MKLINQISGKAYPMEKAGKYPDLSGELIVDDRKTVVEWVVCINEKEAVLPLVPEAEILSASDADRRLLEGATLTVHVDGDVIFERAPLFKKRDRITQSPQPYWFAAIDQDEPRGIFLPNGTIIKSVIEIESKPSRNGMRLKVSLPCEIYRAVEE